MDKSEKQKILDAENRALLTLTGTKATLQDSGKAQLLIDAITNTPMLLGNFNYHLPKESLEAAGLDMGTWQKAEKNGIVDSQIINGRDSFVFPVHVNYEEMFIKNNFVDMLRDIAEGKSIAVNTASATPHEAPHLRIIRGDKEQGETQKAYVR